MRAKTILSRILFGALVLVFLPIAAMAQITSGLQPGAKAPAFKLNDERGKPQTLSSLSGPNGLLLLFFRSADWCPFCKGQLVDLQSAQQAFAAKGIGVAAISYDSPAILSDFAQRRHITYPLLSDPSSAAIEAFGIRNKEATGMQSGIPYPGYFLLTRDGLIQKRFFESAYVNRLTASNLYGNLFGNFAIAALSPSASTQLPATPHVTASTAQSDSEVTPGAVVQLRLTLQPGADTHIYAPGAEKFHYHVIALTLPPSSLYTTTPIAYPPSELLQFPDLGETVPVYTRSTVLSTSVSAVVNEKTLHAFADHPQLSVEGTLAYQPCTSKVCFPPVTVPVSWKIDLRPLDRERVPVALQHQ